MISELAILGHLENVFKLKSIQQVDKDLAQKYINDFIRPLQVHTPAGMDLLKVLCQADEVLSMKSIPWSVKVKMVRRIREEKVR